MDISLDLVVEAARRRLAALTPEVAGYVVLLATQRLEPRPSQVSAASVLLTETGEVHVWPEFAATGHEVEIALRGLLAILLEQSASPAPAITAVAEGEPNGGLHGLTSELSAALIPINHAAARRALARLYRETSRARGQSLEPPAPAAGAEASPEASDPNTAAELLDTPPLPLEAPPEASEQTPEIDEAPLGVEETTPTLEAAERLEGTGGLEAAAFGVPPFELSPFETEGLERPTQLTPLPPPVARLSGVEEMRELDIDVDLDADEEPAPTVVPPRELPPVAPVRAMALTRRIQTVPARRSERRSDVRALLERFAGPARSDAEMTRELRAMIGLAACAPGTGSSLAPGAPAVPP